MQRVSGFTFLEILVSLAVLSIALMGMDSLQWRMLQNTRYQSYAVKAEQFALGLAARRHASDLLIKEVRACLPQGQFEVQAKRVIVTWGGLLPSACVQPVLGRAGCVIVTA